MIYNSEITFVNYLTLKNVKQEVSNKCQILYTYFTHLAARLGLWRAAFALDLTLDIFIYAEMGCRFTLILHKT